MGYFVRAFCVKDNIPSFQELLDWINGKGYCLTVDGPVGAKELALKKWGQYGILYKQDKLPIIVNCDCDDGRENSLFAGEIEEFLGEI